MRLIRKEIWVEFTEATIKCISNQLRRLDMHFIVASVISTNTSLWTNRIGLTQAVGALRSQSTMVLFKNLHHLLPTVE